ncbi:lipocalin family protein [Thiocapsa rosea]|uniref:lipocalin family protein n=1 Tax=Thiocapsa rosea TaxID=69360 RepID=UPI0011C3C1D1|nr:lipocalin family protein [Thiocapsa rosea]
MFACRNRGGPGRRQPHLPAETLEDLIAKARAAGFETDTLIFPAPAVPTPIAASPE